MIPPKHLIACLCMVTAIVHSAAGQTMQYHFEPLSIDRPDVSNLPTTVLPKQYQFELGTEWAKGPRSREFYQPNLVFRTGISRKAELRIGFNQLFLDSIADRPDDNLLFFFVGGKYRFVEEDGPRPSMAIQPEFSLADYSVVFLFNNTLHKQVFINYNAGIFWSRNGRVDYLVSASTSFLHTHRLGYYLEAYALVEENSSFPLSFNGGLMYLIYPRLQMDVYFGNRGVDTERFWFGGAGVGFRIDRGDLVRKDFKDTGIAH